MLFRFYSVLLRGHAHLVLHNAETYAEQPESGVVNCMKSISMGLMGFGGKNTDMIVELNKNFNYKLTFCFNLEGYIAYTLLR